MDVRPDPSRLEETRGTSRGLDGLRFAVVDVETTGLQVTRHHILQIAVVTVDVNGRRLDEWSTYTRGRRWPLTHLGPRRIHGISRAMLRHAPTRPAALAEFARRVDGTVLTAHNAEFDLSFLLRAAERYRVRLPEVPLVCTLALSRSLDPDAARSHRLVDVCRRYGVDLDRPHDALADAQATAAALAHLVRDAGITTWDQLAAAGTPRRRVGRDQTAA